MSTRLRPAARRASRSLRTALRVRPELLQLESRDQPTRLGLSIATSAAADMAQANVAAVTSELPVTLTMTTTTQVHDNGHGRGVGGAADAPGLTIASAVPSAHSAVVEVFSASTIILITFTPAPAAGKVTPPESTGDSGGATQHAVARRAAPAANAAAAQADVVATVTAAPAATVAPTATPVAAPATTPVSITPATAAAFISAPPTNVVPTAAPAAAAATTPFALVPQNAAVTTPQAGGGGGRTEIAAAMANTITGVAYPPATADRTGVPTGTPAAEQTPAPQPPTTDGDAPAAATNQAKAEEKAEERMSFTTRLTAIIASVAVTMYGFWYWWHRSVKPRGGSGLRLIRRGTTDV